MAATLQLTSLTATPTVGAPMLLELRVTGLGVGELLGAYDLDLLFDASRVGSPLTTFSDALGVDGLDTFSNVSLSTGRLDFASVSLLDSAELATRQAGGDFALAQFRFDGLGAGLTLFELDLGNALFADALGSSLSIDLGSPLRLSIATAGGGGTVSEPPLLPLFGLAIAALARRRVGARSRV